MSQAICGHKTEAPGAEVHGYKGSRTHDECQAAREVEAQMNQPVSVHYVRVSAVTALMDRGERARPAQREN